METRGKGRPCSTGFFAPSWGHVMGTLEGGWGVPPSPPRLPLGQGQASPSRCFASNLARCAARCIPPAFLDVSFPATTSPGMAAEVSQPHTMKAEKAPSCLFPPRWDSGRERTGAISRPHGRAPRASGDLPATTIKGRPLSGYCRASCVHRAVGIAVLNPVGCWAPKGAP